MVATPKESGVTDSMTLEGAVIESLRRGEVGVQVAVCGPNGITAEAWAGIADRRSGSAVDETTVFPVFSVTKALTATALHMMVDRGLVSYDEFVACYWPEYGAAGKERTTVRDALTHRAGVPDMPVGATPELVADWEWVARGLAAMTPAYPPGTTNAYHSASWGWIIGEIVRRVDPAHRPLDQFVTDEILEPLGIKDCWIGLPEEADERLAALTGTLSLPGRPPKGVYEKDYGPERWRGGSPSGGAILTARAGSRFFAMLANGGELDGIRIVSEKRLRESLAPRESAGEPDATAGRVRWIGAGGYWLGGTAPPAEPIVASGRNILWHPGVGGSVGWADLDRHIGVVICHNRLFDWEGVARPRHPFGAIADMIDELSA